MKRAYGQPPEVIGTLDLHLSEQMHYLYLPIIMREGHPARLPPALESLHGMVAMAAKHVAFKRYCYLSAVRGIASPGNSLNRPGWHCDGFGTDDVNVVWWKGPGTRFAVQPFRGISDDDAASLDQFDSQVQTESVISYPEGAVLLLNPYVVHAVPVIEKVCERQFVKLSFSNDRYDLDGNSHNYLFDYQWDMQKRHESRNVTCRTPQLAAPNTDAQGGK